MCTVLVIILGSLFLFFIVLDKTCHTVPMMLVANTCLSTLVLGCSMLSLRIFTFQNDLKQIQYEDSLCVFRAYVDYVSSALYIYSFLLQAIYRYVTVVYPNRLFFQSVRFQASAICLTWVFCFLYPFPFMFNGEIIYNVDNQICQLPLHLSFFIIYGANCVYAIPVSMIMSIYFKLVRYVHGMNKRATPINTLSRAQRELKMVHRIVSLITIIMTTGVPYGIFIIMSFFNRAPKYHFRIAFLFVDVSLVFVMIPLFQFTDPLKTSVMKRIKPRPNVVVARVA
jgi:hypothetical protein